jgi:hypothetical protein
MKTKFNVSTVVLALFGFTAVQTATAQAPKSSPANEALKGLRPFIGNWAGESESFGGYEGLKKDGKIHWTVRFRWLLNKTAVEYAWQVKYKDTGKNFGSGNQIVSLDAATGKLRTIGYGHDGGVYWSNMGSIEIDGKSFTQVVNEITINKTKSKYTVKRKIENPKTMSVEATDQFVEGKELKDLPIFKLHRVVKAASGNLEPVKKYVGSYTARVVEEEQGFETFFYLKLKPDSTFNGWEEGDESNKVVGSWKVLSKILVCHGENSNEEIAIKLDKKTMKVLSLAVNGEEAEELVEANIVFKKD